MNPESNICPLCSHGSLQDGEYIAHDTSTLEKTVSIRACPACDFAWQWPLQRTSAQSAEIFHSEYQAERKSSYFDKEQRQDISILQLEFLQEIFPQKKNILDIGCGDGSFARKAADLGWAAVGLDPAIPRDIQNAATGSHLKFIQGTLEDLDQNEKFMCVTLWDVVEHLPDPQALLKNAWKLVAPGGWLVLETGNYQSAERLLSGPRWWAWQLDHRWYFSPSTLLEILKPLQFSEHRLAQRVFRPWSEKKPDFKAPSRFHTFLSIIKRPWKLSSTVADHALKRHAASKWPQWAGLSIFTIAIKKPQLDR